MNQSTTKHKNLFSWILLEDHSLFCATILSALSVLFFFIIRFPSFFSLIHSFSQKWFGISVILLYLAVSFALGYWQKWSMSKLLSVWIQSNILFLFAITYFIRVNNSSLSLSFFEISTGLVFIPLSAFIFLVNKNLFGKNQISVPYNLGQVFLISLCVFSLVYYFEIDNVAVKISSSDILLQLFRLPNTLWLGLSAVSIGLISTLSLKLKDATNSVLLFLFFFITTAQTVLILNNLSLGYWSKTLILITAWDYVFNAVLSFLRHPNYNEYKTKFLLSTAYHILLLVIIFIFNYIKL